MSSAISDTRTRILKAAWTLLEASQGKGVRMTDIAKQAGVSRQAVYLHFPTRSQLLSATTRYLDEVYKVEEALVVSRNAASGLERLDAFIDWWGNYIPRIYAIAKALLAMKDTDEAAAQAWNDRMQAVREGCAAAILALKTDGILSPQHAPKQATDILWTMLSVRNCEQLTIECRWSQKRYIQITKQTARQILAKT